MYKLAIFDMDGTILNTIEDLANGVNHALAQNGMPQRTLDYVRSIVGNGIFTTLRLCAPPDITDRQLDDLHTAFAPYYEAHRTDNTRPYDGIEQLLKRLIAAGVKTSVVSNKSDDSVKALCVQYFDGLFDMPCGLKKSVPKKPAPDSVNMVINSFGFDKSEVIYIGDSEVDVMTAQNAGIDSILVTWGFRTREMLKNAGAETIVDTTDEVFDIITK